MRPTRLLALLSILWLAGTVALPQNYYDDEEEERSRRKQDLPPAGFWPTDRMMDLFIDRLTEDMSRAYDFDEDQLYNTRELFKERIPTWLNENRAEIMQLSNEYIEALMAGEPPDVDYVADWAQQALPLFDDFTDVAEEMGEDMRTYLTEDQQVILDGQIAAFRVGMSYVQQRLGNWSEGGFDAQTEWPGNPRARRIQRDRDRQIRREAREAELVARGELVEAADGTLVQPGEVMVTEAAATAKPAAKAAANVPKDEWTKYVEDFIRRYQLSEEQQATAYKILRVQQEQRDKYLRRVGNRLNEAKQELEKAEGPEQRARVEDAHQRLVRPLDRMFKQLKEKLDKLPTRKQRLEATKQIEVKPAQEQKPAEAKEGAEPPAEKRESPSSP